MAKASQLTNPSVKVAILETLDYNSPLTERDPKTMAKTLGSEEDYPYPKTYSGVLQLKVMPHDYYRRGTYWLSFATFALVSGYLLK